ncbi:trnahis guanylyltransferase [Grosmannia clavigera kw1407]|uniref:tRNA(His) guanylyltransferase n=1 Tax=Grosmannia clavigera (strain kw1407 / UAMH 11150) TaxID=655863 RepID=F0XS81_GROCL|nr:trnahis guanylyltransferase [Grosmannia clavigera kw1407]EFW99460.1 trnahis guanylyltransferase [Grosmannia clavigera kw1407]
MANSKYEYVRLFEQSDTLLPNTWIVVRIDGRGFTKLCAKFGFEKPNDKRALDLMNAAAKAVMSDLPDISLAYGVSDEYSFVFHKACQLFERRSSKLVSTVVSTFTAFYVHLWPTFFPETPLTSSPMPTFDGRAVCYPSHINNLYNTTFWALVQKGGMDSVAATDLLKGTFSADKNEMLFSKFHMNYNNEPDMFKKGSVVFRDYELVDPKGYNAAEVADSQAEPPTLSKSKEESDKKRRAKARITAEHLDIIKDDFWDRRPWLLTGQPGTLPKQL